MNTIKKISFVLLVLAISMNSCKKVNGLKEEDIPSTYNFENVDYSGQTARLDMLEEMTALMKTANNIGVAISANDLKNMFANENDPFSQPELNANTKNIESKTFAADVNLFKSYMENLASLSGSTAEGEAGIAGVATSGTKSYLLNENGVEYTQLIEKGLMGALAYYQVAEVYTRDEQIGDEVDNETVEPGKGTSLEHHWDEAFGYIGANNTFDESNFRYHAKYASNGENVGLNTRTNLFQALLAGRAAISAKDSERKKIEAVNVRKYMEEVTATTAIHYLNGGKANITDYAIASHELSEAYAFIFSLKYNADKIISDADLKSVLSYLENADGEADFANISVAKINMAIDKLSNIYGYQNVKDRL